jgi:hypothetical protein
MKSHIMQPRQRFPGKDGFALIVTLSMMILLVILALGPLTLSSVSLRAAAQGSAMATARANARLALMLAIGELQKQAGPDQRITAPAGILDSTPATPEVDGVPQMNWLGVWDSWGAWINSSYASPRGVPMKIQDTYVAGRKPMFRRWLVSGEPPATLEAAKAADPFAENPVALVNPIVPGDSRKARAGLVSIKTSVHNQGGFAWWIGGENQKADIALNAPPASLGVAATEAATGNAVSRRLSEADGLDALTRDPVLVPLLLTTDQATLGGADAAKLRAHFHDLTAYSSGLITDVRWGGLRKDMSLLFDAAALPRNMTRTATSAKSPRPMSSDLSRYGPQIPERPFTSFEQLYQFARQYKNTASLTDDLTWSGVSPSTPATNTVGSKNPDEHEYRRMPILVKSYCIFNLQSETNTSGATPTYKYWLTYSPVVQLWNPYNVPLEVESDAIQVLTFPYKIFPIQFKKMVGGAAQGNWTSMDVNFMAENGWSKFQGDGGYGKIRFKSGEFMMFSFKTRFPGTVAGGIPLTPGFDPAAVGSVRAEIRFSPAVLPADNPGLALRTRPYISAAGDLVNYCGGNPGSFCQIIPWGTFSGINIDWFGDATGDFTMFAPDSGPNIARWQIADSNPVPVAVFGMTLKSSEKPTYDSAQDDWRSRTWIQSPPAMDAEGMEAVYGNPELLAKQRRNCSLQAHWKTINGVAEMSELIPHLNTSGFMGGGTAGSEKIAAAAVLELPTAPVQSLAGFSGLRLQPGWFNYAARNANFPEGGVSAPQKSDANMEWRLKVGAYRSGVPGVGVGNSFACPMIAGDSVYAYHDISKINLLSHDPPVTISASKSDSNAYSDFWDHAMLVNDGLWDSWFLSSLTDARRPTDVASPALRQLLDKTFTQRLPLPNANFNPFDQADPQAVIADLSKSDGYLRAAQYLANRGAFNVNSVSVDAWLALFASLRDHEASYRNDRGTLTKIAPPTGSAVVTRFNTETSGVEAPDPRSGVMVNGLPSWSGVRFINNAQLKLLSEKCVEQVKIRGPFLNFSDFINRRLSADALGTRGALQAAIDYDDESPDPASINFRYKKGGASDMLTLNDATPAAYPFPAAATGSRFTAVPGYVIQSDLLKPLGNALAVRDDTFRIRACGQALDSAGNVTARAWCEATVQRVPEYIDPSNPPSVSPTNLDSDGNPSPNAALTAHNQRFGRRLQMVSFRWLSANEL